MPAYEKRLPLSGKWLALGITMLCAILLITAALWVAASQRSQLSASPGEAVFAPRQVIRWQEKEAPALVPVQRDTSLYRSVSLPPAHIVEKLLVDQGALPLNASAEEIEQAVKQWYQVAQKDAYTGPNPQAYRKLLEREKALLNSAGSLAPEDESLPTPQKSLLGVVVEFDPPGGAEVITRTYPVDPSDPTLGCTIVTQTFGTLVQGQDPPPGPRDNFSFYKEGGFTTADYQSAFFDTGPNAGYGVVRQDLGGIDLSGYSLNNYLLEMSRGVYTTSGEILSLPVTLTHAHEFYGYAQYSEDSGGDCVAPTFSDANYNEYVPDVIDAIVAQYGDSLDWSQFDADGDHIVDLLVTIHSGYGFQTGGGEDRLSTSSSSFYPSPVQIGGFSTPGDTSDDYFIEGFNVDPEQLDVGAIQEEFEHQFGLPDTYVVDADNSNSFWSAHSSGVWGGPLGATRPVGHSLWQDWVLGWRDPMIIDYNDPMILNGEKISVTLGRARYTPAGSEDGLIVRLPEEAVLVDNLAGTGVGWWSDSGDLLDNRVYRDFNLITATAPITFSFDASWDIETDWDYGYLEISTNGGITWTSIADISGVLTDTNPNGNNLGWGLTGTGSGVLMFDLSAYAGQTIGVRFRYVTDPAVSNPGWWVDNPLLADAGGILYSNDLETDFSDWTNEGWIVTPYELIVQKYYLAEWRDDNGFDQSLNDPYHGVYSNPVEPPPEFQVDRLPATTPGLILAYRNTGQGFDYSLTDSYLDGPSIGPKFAHLVVESHFEPRRWDTLFSSVAGGYVGPNLNGRVLPGDAAFGFQPTNEWTAHLGFDFDAGQYMTTTIETKTWTSDPPVMAFHDSYGYYPGFFYPGSGPSVYYHDSDASTTLPTKGPYSTRITDPAGNPFTALYGIPFGPSYLGTGNPGDDHVQYGLHIEVAEGAEEQGTIWLWNTLFEVKASADANIISPTNPLTSTFTFSVDENIGGKIIDPYIVVELPDGVEYVEGSAFGGMAPVGGTFADAAAVAAYVEAVGYESLAAQAPAAADQVHFLVWSGDDIWTNAGTPPFGFNGAMSQLAIDVNFNVSFFKDGTDQFQSEQLSAVLLANTIYLPIAER